MIDKDTLMIIKDLTYTQNRKRNDKIESKNWEMDLKKRAPLKYSLCSSYEYTVMN